LADLRSGEREMISEQLSSITGLFVDNSGDTLIFLSSGVTFKVDISAAGRSANRVESSAFAEYGDIALDFLRKLGFAPDASQLALNYEEREGLGVHEVAVELAKRDDPNSVCLLRIDGKTK